MALISPIRAQRTIDTGSIPGTQIDDSIGQGLRAVGQSVQQAGADLNEIDMRQQRMKNQAEEFKADQASFNQSVQVLMNTFMEDKAKV